MNFNQQFGRRGEDRAARYLEESGWTILERNWRCREGEADIVALDPHTDSLVVVEVKSRSGEGFGSPLESITYAKARRLRQLAAIYARQAQVRARLLRVDAIGLLWPRGQECKLIHARGIEE
ncbi:MAG TPA: YraN family protein [Tessaracoccus flavescens]|uniref:UPF0102 protein K8V15_04555 n=1 Tax=Tessaracoccus flavescens TaxID=399497 RepID=A0A921ENG4_9ACTN|nr:YraN family protein [Tessaracoccus flavescens]